MKTTTKVYTVRVQTKTYLRKYAEVKYGTNIKYNSTLSILLICLLERKCFTTKMNEDRVNSRMHFLNDQIEFTSSFNTAWWKGVHLGDDKIIAINRFLESQFEIDLHAHCSLNKERRDWRPGIDKAIRSFADQYRIDLDVDITFDALKKKEYRYRKELQGKLVTFVPSYSRVSSCYAAS